MRIERAPIERLGLGEGAVWDADEQALYVLDIFGMKVLRHDPAGGANRSWQTPGHVGALALREGGGAGRRAAAVRALRVGRGVPGVQLRWRRPSLIPADRSRARILGTTERSGNSGSSVLNRTSMAWKVPPAGFEPAAFCSGGRRSIP